MYRSGINVLRPGAEGYKTMTRRYSGRGKDRFWEIDFLRGLCVLLMVFDHLMYCLWDLMPAINQMFGTHLFTESRQLALRYWNWDVRDNVRLIVISVFFLLCGVSCTLTRGNFRRSIPLALVAAGISFVTSLLEQLGMGRQVIFGVIHMLACGIFLYAVYDGVAGAVCGVLGEGKAARIAKYAIRFLPGVMGIVFLAWLFGGGYAELRFAYGVWDVHSLYDAAGATNAEKTFVSTFLYIRNFTPDSGDYFPILPWAALVLIGGIFGRLCYHTDAKYAFAPFGGAWNSGICFFGRHAAVIYIAHMVAIPVFLALCAAISMLFT